MSSIDARAQQAWTRLLELAQAIEGDKLDLAVVIDRDGLEHLGMVVEGYVVGILYLDPVPPKDYRVPGAAPKGLQ